MPYIAAELTVDPASKGWPQPAAPADGTRDLVQPPAATPLRSGTARVVMTTWRERASQRTWP
jgi:hypothetical protein